MLCSHSLRMRRSYSQSWRKVSNQSCCGIRPAAWAHDAWASCLAVETEVSCLGCTLRSKDMLCLQEDRVSTGVLLICQHFMGSAMWDCQKRKMASAQ